MTAKINQSQTSIILLIFWLCQLNVHRSKIKKFDQTYRRQIYTTVQEIIHMNMRVPKHVFWGTASWRLKKMSKDPTWIFYAVDLRLATFCLWLSQQAAGSRRVAKKCQFACPIRSVKLVNWLSKHKLHCQTRICCSAQLKSVKVNHVVCNTDIFHIVQFHIENLCAI